MADYTSDRTGANIDTVLDNADNSGIGANPINNTGRNILALPANQGSNFSYENSAINGPAGLTGFFLQTHSSNQTSREFKLAIAPNAGNIYASMGGNAWRELYHTGNTGNVFYQTAMVVGSESIILSSNSIGGLIDTSRATTGTTAQHRFWNPNGEVGAVTTSGTSTSYTTASDPRLKDFKAAPTDIEVNAKFDDLFGCFKTFNWKNDVDGEVVWGFDAHACIDAGLAVGREGEGSRDLALGDVYDTTPAELDEDGNEIKAAVEHKVSPAGVDQSKAVPILLAKIEQLERRLKALEV